jgi:DNA repair protein RecN (Recombination protein N)
MLQHLSIRHFAIIDELELEFQPGLNILSGETGAGKSIIVQALGLIAGSRGYSDLIRSGEDECEVSAVFEVETSSSITDFLIRQGYPCEGTLILRRILNRSGKGRVWVNDRPSTVGVLQEINRYLIDLVSQHESQNLLSDEKQRLFLDSFGGHAPLIKSYQTSYQNYLSLKSELEGIESQAKQAREREDLYRFQLREIDEADLKLGEEEELFQEKKILAHASKINETLSSAEALLYSANDSVTELLGRAQGGLAKIREIDPELDRRGEMLGSLSCEIDEIARFFQTYLQKIDFDPERLSTIEDRLDQIAHLKRKFRGSIEAVLEKKAELEKNITLLDHYDETLKSLQEKWSATRNELLKKAEELTQARKKTAQQLARLVEKELKFLAMTQTQFVIDVSPLHFENSSEGPNEPHFTSTGKDEVKFFISPNKGEEPKALALIASGGELSRILLALKSVLRTPQSVSSYLFDEVDAGIGGAIAEVVGQKLKKLAEFSQVICITHLPQIAAFADAHFQISKSEKKQRIVTQVRKLSEKEREEEIARMLAGVQVTEQARLHARELLGKCLST